MTVTGRPGTGRYAITRPGPSLILFSHGSIVQARDLVESSVKPGSSSLQLLAAVTPLIRKLGPNADPANLRRLPIAAAGLWVFYAAYSAYIAKLLLRQHWLECSRNLLRAQVKYDGIV